MTAITKGTSVPVRELIECIDAFIVDLLQADEKRGTERVSAFVSLVDKHDMFDNDDAIQFAMIPLDKSHKD